MIVWLELAVPIGTAAALAIVAFLMARALRALDRRNRREAEEDLDRLR